MTTDDEEGAAVREAFSLLDHEIRLEILLALLEDWHAVYTEPQSYTELMDAVGMRDSGKFNYHLDKLRGVYVREVEDGYVPTASVTALYRAVLAHRPSDRLGYDPTTIDSACPRCDAAPILRYERGFVSVECPACDDWVGFTYPFPKNGFEGRSADAVVRATTRRARHHIALARDGQCPFCAGTTSVDLHLDEIEDETLVEIACDTCTFLVGVEPLPALLFADRVAGVLADAGVDLDRYDWELPTPTTRIHSRDPLRVALEVAGDAATITIVVDGELAVRSVDVDR